MGNACAGSEAQKVEHVEAQSSPKDEPAKEPAQEPEVPQPQEPKLIVTIIAARGLRNSDWLPGLGKPDCYCVIKSEGKELFTTRVINDTLEPVWDDVAQINDYTDGKPLEFSVYDKDVVGSDFLGRVLVESGKFASGFNGELQLDEAGKGIKAYLRFKIKVAGKDLPDGPPPLYHFTIEKGSHSSYGLELDVQDGKYLQVVQVRPGPFAEYNQKAEPGLRLVPTDYIASVNGATGTSTAMLDALKKETKVTISVRREVLEIFILNRKGVDTPLGAEFPKKPQLEALVITNIGPGLLTEFNEKATDENKKFKVGDRIVAVAGFKGKATDLYQQLLNTTGQFQLMISRPAPEDKSGHWRFWG